MNYPWEIAYLDLDATQLVLKLTYGSHRCLPMIIFDIAHLHNWKLGDRIAITMGEMSPWRQVQKDAGVSMDEEDYTLFNQRTGGRAPVRKNDFECEDAFAWLRELVAKGLVDCPRK